MEDGTGGQRKEKKRRKEIKREKTAEIENRTGSMCVSFHALVIYCSFERCIR